MVSSLFPEKEREVSAVDIVIPLLTTTNFEEEFSRLSPNQKADVAETIRTAMQDTYPNIALILNRFGEPLGNAGGLLTLATSILSERVKDTGGRAGSFVGGVWDTVKGKVEELIADALTSMGRALMSVKSKLEGWIADAVDFLVPVFEKVVNVVSKPIVELHDNFSTLLDVIRTSVDSTFNSVVSAAGSAIAFSQRQIQETIDKSISFITEVGEKIKSGIEEGIRFFGELGSITGTAIASGVNEMGTFIHDGIVDLLNDFAKLFDGRGDADTITRKIEGDVSLPIDL